MPYDRNVCHSSAATEYTAAKRRPTAFGQLDGHCGFCSNADCGHHILRYLETKEET